MAAPPLIFRVIGMVFTSILYGVYCLIFGVYWRIQLKRPGSKGVLLYPLTASFILCTAYFFILVFEVEFLIAKFVLDEFSPEAQITLLWTNVASNVLYIAIDLISQLILIYRCWIMWSKPLVLVVPCILSLAFLVTSLTTLGFEIKYVANGSLDVPPWFQSAVTSFFSLSLGVNTLVTGLIVYKIVAVYRDIRGFKSGGFQASTYGNGQRNLYPLISILVESGLITFVGQLTQSIMYKTTTPGFPLVAGSVVMLYGISTTVVLVRVEMGITYDHNSSKTAYSTNPQRPIQLAPFSVTSKNNQTSIIDIEARASEDPSYYTHSDSKFDIRPN